MPWVKPWRSSSGLLPQSLPQNALTKHHYSGINILLLWSTLDERGFVNSQWLTFKQALALGGAVRKGESGTHVYFADNFVPAKEKQKAQDEGIDPASVHFLKRYTVFNVAQCDGLPEGLTVAREPLSHCETAPHAEALIAATCADFRIGGDQAFYVPSQDFIRIPHHSSFVDEINYYRTAFHELGHWTGHKKRLNRSLTTKFGTVDYAREELVAEMATAFVCASRGIVPTVHHADYIGNWLQVLKEDARAIVKAASLASKACDFILQFQSNTVEVETLGAAV